MNSKSKIWQYLITHNNQATNAELADWMRGQKGQLSIGQRLREIRKSMQRRGGNLECKEVKSGIYRYRIIYPEPPRTEQEEVIAENNLAQETKINLAIIEKGKQLQFI